MGKKQEALYEHQVETCLHASNFLSTLDNTYREVIVKIEFLHKIVGKWEKWCIKLLQMFPVVNFLLVVLEVCQ